MPALLNSSISCLIFGIVTNAAKSNSAANFSQQIRPASAEAVTAVMPALANCIFQSRQGAGTHMISSLCVVLVYVADTVLNTVTTEPRIDT